MKYRCVINVLMITQKCVKMNLIMKMRGKIVEKRPNLKKAMEGMDKTDLKTQEGARQAALEALHEATDFVLIHLNKEGGGTIGAVSGNRRKPMMECLVETLKSMAKSTLEGMLGEELNDE